MAKIFQGLGPKRRESCNGDQVYDTREFKDVVFQDVVFDNNRFDIDVTNTNNVYQGHKATIIEHHILKHHIPELPIIYPYLALCIYNISLNKATPTHMSL